MRYRFGRSESLGLVGHARPSQCFVVLAGVGASLGAMYALPLVLAPLGFVFLAVSVALAFLPMRGLPLVDWIRLAVAHQIDRARGRARWRRRARRAARSSRVRGRSRRPELGAASDRRRAVRERAVGVLMDAARQTASATMIVRTESFALLADADQERRVAAWGGVLVGSRARVGQRSADLLDGAHGPGRGRRARRATSRPSATAPCRSTAPQCSPTSS